MVVTYQSPAGLTIDLCDDCATRHMDARDWPRDGRGEEYCTVSHGAHHGECESPLHENMRLQGGGAVGMLRMLGLAEGRS